MMATEELFILPALLLPLLFPFFSTPKIFLVFMASTILLSQDGFLSVVYFPFGKKYNSAPSSNHKLIQSDRRSSRHRRRKKRGKSHKEIVREQCSATTTATTPTVTNVVKILKRGEKLPTNKDDEGSRSDHRNQKTKLVQQQQQQEDGNDLPTTPTTTNVIKILKRGEKLPTNKDDEGSRSDHHYQKTKLVQQQQQQQEEEEDGDDLVFSSSNTAQQQEEDGYASNTAPLGMKPNAMVPKLTKFRRYFNNVGNAFSGPTFVSSPSPSFLPFPAGIFSKKKENDNSNQY